MSPKVEYLEQGDLNRLFKDKAKGWIAPSDFPDEQEIMDLSPQGFFPLKDDIFKAFELIAPEEVQYVILGQDPYFNVDDNLQPYATGLAFDVPDNCCPIPRSLKLISECLQLSRPQERLLHEFRDWRDSNKILLLNAALTVAQNKPGSHKTLWRNFVRGILDQINGSAQFIAWGSLARDLMSHGLKTNRVVKGYSYHPQARDGGKSFRNFWTGGIGAKLLKSRRKSDQL